MAIVVEFIKSYAPWIYGVCAFIALWYLRVVILARRERRYAAFSLEREAALNRTYGAWSMAVVLLSVMGLVYFLSTVVSDAVRPLVEVEIMESPTPPSPPPAIVQAGDIPTLPVPEPSPTPAPTAKPPTPQPEPTRTPSSPTPPPATAAPVVQAPRCPDARSIISSPGLNATVSGMVPIMGTAVHEQFQYYKLEFGAGANPAVWSYFAGGERPVQGGHLGTLNGGALAPGTYSIRVVVVDLTGNFPNPCQTVVNIN
jgi:hypothetical protein